MSKSAIFQDHDVEKYGQILSLLSGEKIGKPIDDKLIDDFYQQLGNCVEVTLAGISKQPLTQAAQLTSESIQLLIAAKHIASYASQYVDYSDLPNDDTRPDIFFDLQKCLESVGNHLCEAFSRVALRQIIHSSQVLAQLGFSAKDLTRSVKCFDFRTGQEHLELLQSAATALNDYSALHEVTTGGAVAGPRGPTCPEGVSEISHQALVAAVEKLPVGYFMKRSDLGQARMDDSIKSRWLGDLCKQGFLEHNGKKGNGSAYKILKPLK